jgi:hypothetical protein
MQVLKDTRASRSRRPLISPRWFGAMAASGLIGALLLAAYVGAILR